MTLEEALLIDKEQNILPGGQGEHDFCVSDSAEIIDAQLDSFAEQCGGFYYRNGITSTLDTCDCGTFIITFAPDLSRVQSIKQDTGFLYWDYTKARVRGIGYQQTNAFEPLLEDFQSEDEKTNVG